MRVHVYQEELGEGIEIVEQDSRDGRHYYGLRIWLRTCQPLLDHSTATDDDRSAVTFWASSRAELVELVDDMHIACEKG